MKKYFKNIIKPKWYHIVFFILLFIFQCMSIINICPQFGGEYYLIVPLQLFTGYLNVLIYLMIQKDIKQKHFVAVVAIAIALAVALSFVIFDGLYTSEPGFEGVVNGIIMQLTLSVVSYAVIKIASDLILNKKDKLETT